MEDHSTEANLRATSDAFVAQLAEISEMEQRKRALVPTNPEFTTLADQVEQSVRVLLDQSRKQRDLSWDARRANLETPIAGIPADASAMELLAQWRAAEDELSGLESGSERALEARLKVEAYRRAYESVFGLGEQSLDG